MATAAEPGRGAGFPIGLTLVTAVALAILVGLGVWQGVYRLPWKEGILARIHALQSAAPTPIATVLAHAKKLDDFDFTRVRADCPNIETSVYVRLWTVPDARSGYRIITACHLVAPPYASILVDRGFVALDDAAKVKPGERLAGSIIGVLRQGDRRNFFTPPNQPDQNLWYSRDIPAMARALGVSDPAPVFLMLERPAPAGPGPTPMAVPADIPNNHLQYAVTWFGLAAALAGVYLASLWRRRQG
jgi:surfeit locus 1 family protein